jgi:hypothetical protein
MDMGRPRKICAGRQKHLEFTQHSNTYHEWLACLKAAAAKAYLGRIHHDGGGM